MANSWSGAHNGPPNNNNWDGAPQANPPPPSVSQPAGFARPFTLAEVLPYTPFSAIAPFDSSVLPSPSIGSASPAPPVTDLIPSLDFESLNQEASTNTASRLLQQTVGQVQRLLERGNIPEYKFKTGPRATTSPSPAKHSSLAAGLSPFSKMVHDSTSIPFRYPTPDTPTPAANNHPNVITTPVPTKQKISAKPVIKKEPGQGKKLSSIPANTPGPSASPATSANQQAHAANKARFEIVLPTKKELEQPAGLANIKPHPSSNVTPRAPPAPVAPPTPAYHPQYQPQVQHSPQVQHQPQVHQQHQVPQQHQVQQQQQQQQQRSQQHPPQPALPPLSSVEATAASRTATPPERPGSQSISSSQKPVIAIELPKTKTFDKSEFMVVADEPEEPANLPLKKRKHGDIDGDDIYGESLDLRQRADAALHDLRVFLHNAFQAENAVLARRQGNDMVVLVSENEATLTATAQSKAQALLGKTITLNCFKNSPLEELLHLIRLSEGALKLAETLDIKVDETWVAADVEQWLSQLPWLEIAIRAGRTSLRIMCGGRQEKQLYSQDTIEHCLDLFKRIIDGIVIPIAELRATPGANELFKTLAQNKKKIVALFNDCQKLFSMMATLISSIDTSDAVTNTLEFTASRLIFMETAHAEKDSVIDTQKFDGLRLVAMDMLSQIFLLNPEQRKGIFNEILSSLEKLPLGKRARTFKLVDGTSIQPVSALIMRLVQTSAGKVGDAGRGKGNTMPVEDEAAEGPRRLPQSFSIQDEEHGSSQHRIAIQELDDVSEALIKTATNSASDVVQFIVSRALKSTKSGDTPYRNLLDMFVEDFALCLDNPDWPAAELLLRIFMHLMFQLIENDKQPVTAKNMALELLGSMGAAVSKLRGHVRKGVSSLDTQDSDGLGLLLSDLAAAALELKSRPEQMVAWTGPYRATLEHLESRFSEDPHLASAISFLVSDWASKTCKTYDDYEDDVAERDHELGRLAYRLRQMIHDRQWLSREYSFKDISQSYARLSYSITLLRSPLCEAFNTILNILLNSMASDQPTVRSKSLKSVNQVLETDPSILDGDSVVVQLILRCSNDSSTQVRDSALGLIGKCISMRPALEEQITPTVVERFNDAGHGVRKRAMKLAKDIYLRNSNRTLRSTIANGLLHRIQDPEESVRELAKQVIEEIWFAPFHSGQTSAASKISLADHVSLMVQTVNRGNVVSVLDKVLQALLAPSNKTAQASLEVCTKLVESMFDLVDSSDPEDTTKPSGRDVLQILMIFAKAEASLFTFEQLRLLRPYISSIRSNEDPAVSKAVVVIYRRVLPQLSSAHSQFLTEVRSELMPTMTTVSRPLMNEVMACLWIISGLLDTSEHMARLAASSLRNIQALHAKSKTQPLDTRTMRQFERYSLIVGMAGKHFNLDSHLDFFNKMLKTNGSSVSKLMVDLVVPFAAPSYHMDMRKAALDSVGLVCQAWPRNYVSANVYTTFQHVFDEQVPVLEAMVLRSFKEFLLTEEKRSEEAAEAPTGMNGGAKQEKKRELTVIGGTNYDDVASATTHRFLKEIIRIATATQDNHAFLAVEVLASINRQGLVHPKETGVTFITLETSSNPRISELAFLEHKALHAKHETVVEREYVKAVQSAFAYQRDIVKDSRGAIATGNGVFTPKLHLLMEVLKISKSKNRQKFLEKLCGQLDFDVGKLDMGERVPSHVVYVRFVTECLAYFEYLTVGEVGCVVGALERLVTGTGAGVAQAIEMEVLGFRVDVLEEEQQQQQVLGENGQAAGAAAGSLSSLSVNQLQEAPRVELEKLRRLTAGAVVLLGVWEARTYLRRLYGLGIGGRRENKVKMLGKDLSKAPVKAQGVTGEKLWEEMGVLGERLGSREGMMGVCRGFVELMNVDKEFLVGDEDEEGLMEEGGASPMSGGEDDELVGERKRGRKRKSDAGSQGTPGKKKRGRSGSMGGQPRKRGRPKKVAREEEEGEGEEGDWF
ncbi:Sister chromatid cohesion protein 2 [Podospora pseudopauciseta]|uniref:Sister chromatid cohesion protein n=1 Tax=Podospora pseudopauciseta TaxID=2093780 RepID=A0ABR0HGE5_9PEZI|nr:Sister chromatid cohesion protein 2 [Podospora pseudopauciseta]